MSTSETRRPQILVIAGLDPSGGAGLLADQQALHAIDCHTFGLVSCLTVQNSRQLLDVTPVSPQILARQLEAIHADTHIDAIKIGALGSAAVANAIAPILTEWQIPVIVDPVLKAGSGGSLADNALQQAILEQILPLTFLLTPNGPEARALSNESDLDKAATRLMECGCQHVLVTGGHENSASIQNQLWSVATPNQSWQISRFPGEYRGTGCRLSSLIAGFIGKGFTVANAIDAAQSTLAEMIQRHYLLDSGIRIPSADIHRTTS